jgi:hypothetical protein
MPRRADDERAVVAKGREETAESKEERLKVRRNDSK